MDFDSSNSQNISKSKRESRGNDLTSLPSFSNSSILRLFSCPFLLYISHLPSHYCTQFTLCLTVCIFPSPSPFFAHSHLPPLPFPSSFLSIAVSLVQVSLLLIGQQGLGLISSGTVPCFSLTGGLCKFNANAGGKRTMQRQPLLVQYLYQCSVQL